jgi:hypothetical protein
MTAMLDTKKTGGGRMLQSTKKTRVAVRPALYSLPLSVAQTIAVIITSLLLIGLTLLLNAFVFTT